MRLPKYIFPASLFGTTFGIAVIIKDRSLGPKYDNEIRCSGRTVIVTGANSGLGRETARELARRGGKVILACRDLKSAYKTRDEIIEETYNKNVSVKHIDLSSLDSVAKFAHDILSTEKRLDVLVNNAGLMHISKTRQLTADGFELHLGVNYLGAYLLTQLLLPKLIQSRPSRVVNLTTVSMNKANIDFADFNLAADYDPYNAYPRSKLALMSFTQLFNQKYKAQGVTSYAVYPGVATTSLARGLSQSTISSAVFKPTSLLMRTPENAIQSVIYCCLEPGIEEKSGQCIKDMKVMKWTSELSNEDSLRLWKISQVWTQLDKYRQFCNIPAAQDHVIK